MPHSVRMSLVRYGKGRCMRGRHGWALVCHEDWVSKSRIRQGGKAIWEHRSLSLALRFARCYDQLNLLNRACVEVLVSERQLIERAFALGAATAPDYSGAALARNP